MNHRQIHRQLPHQHHRLSSALRLIVLTLAGPACAQVSGKAALWPSEFTNPAPAPGDVLLPLPCGGQMAFRPVAVPMAHALDDRRVQLGHTDERQGYAEGQRPDYVAAGLTDRNKRNQSYYLMGKYEVTRAQFDALTGKCPSTGNDPELRLPKTAVTWLEAVAFAAQYSAWLVRNAGGRLPIEDGQPAFVRLPTEAEWEFAVRGGTSVSPAQFEQPNFDMPEGVHRYAWHAGTSSSNNELNVIGLLKPNPLGLHDMLGNAGEFVLDTFRLNKHSRLHGQAGGFVVKGGDFRTAAGDIRSSARTEYVPVDSSGERRDQATGFRVVVVGPSVTSPTKVQNLRQQWSTLAQIGAAQQRPLPDPVKEIEALANAVTEPALKRRIEGVGSTMKANIQARNEQRDRSARSEVRVAAYLGKKLLEDRAKTRVLQSIIAGPLPEDLKAGHRENLKISEQAISGTLDYLVETLRQIGRDFPRETIGVQAELLKREFESRRAPTEYIPLIDAVARAGRTVADGGAVDSKAVLSELIKIESSKER